MEKKIQTIASLNCNHFSVHLDEIRLRNGQGGKRIRIDHPEAAAVIAYVTDDESIMVKRSVDDGGYLTSLITSLEVVNQEGRGIWRL